MLTTHNSGDTPPSPASFESPADIHARSATIDANPVPDPTRRFGEPAMIHTSPRTIDREGPSPSATVNSISSGCLSHCLTVNRPSQTQRLELRLTSVVSDLFVLSNVFSPSDVVSSTPHDSSRADSSL